MGFLSWLQIWTPWGPLKWLKPCRKYLIQLYSPFRAKLFNLQHGLFTCIHKYYSVEQWKKFANDNPKSLPHVAASSGMTEADFAKLSDILNSIPGITFICLDVANGYSQHFVEYVRKVRAAFPKHTIIVSLFFPQWNCVILRKSTNSSVIISIL